MNSVQVEVSGGPTITVPWVQGLTGRQALEAAWDQVGNTGAFTYALQYFGTGLGYLVSMVNETYDTFLSSSDPFFYWEFLVNGNPTAAGIDRTPLNDGDVMGLHFERYDPDRHSASLLQVKHDSQLAALESPD